MRNNAAMTDVPIYVAVITAAAGIIGAAIPQVSTVIRDVRQAERDRQERYATAARQACVDLLRAAGELRTQVENAHSYRGDPAGMRSRLEDIRGHAAATRLYAASVGLLVPDRLAEPADKLAESASTLADSVALNTDVNQGVMVGDPDVSALNLRIAAFRGEAVGYAKG